MHALLSRSGAGWRIGLLAVVLGGVALAMGRPVGAEPAKAAVQAPVPVLTAEPGFDPNAGIPMTPPDPNEGLIPSLLPAEIEAGILEGAVRGADCPVDLGADPNSAFGPTSNKLRGNIIEVSLPRTLLEFSMKLNVTSGSQLLYFYVYERNTTTGTYRRVKEIIRTATQAGGGTGLRFYSSGQIDNGVGVPLDNASGVLYVVGVAWTTPGVTFYLDNLTYPQNTSFGRLRGSTFRDTAPPYGDNLTFSLVLQGAYRMTVCLDPPTGACCMGTSCVETDRSTCQSTGGEYTEDGFACTNGVCPIQHGACCLLYPGDTDRSCELISQFRCEEQLGEWLGMANSSGVPVKGDADGDGDVDLADWSSAAGLMECLSSNGPVGTPTAACLEDFDFPGYPSPGVDPPDGRIDLYDYSAFADAFGTVPPPVNHCTDNPCALPKGRCCRLGGDCVENVTELECLECDEGSWLEGGDCANACEHRGACCHPVSGCREDTQAGCGGHPWCEGLTCADIGSNCGGAGGCPVLGACCVSGGCQDLKTPTQCSALEGCYLGVATHCCDGAGDCATCPLPTQACCLPDDSCADLTTSQCANSNGDPQGPDTSCTSTDCALIPRACCFTDGFCFDLTTTDCEGAEGTPQAVGSTCATLGGCRGACCLSTGTCIANLLKSECMGFPNDRCWVGGHDCSACSDPSLCPP